MQFRKIKFIAEVGRVQTSTACIFIALALVFWRATRFAYCIGNVSSFLFFIAIQMSIVNCGAQFLCIYLEDFWRTYNFYSIH